MLSYGIDENITRSMPISSMTFVQRRGENAAGDVKNVAQILRERFCSFLPQGAYSNRRCARAIMATSLRPCDRVSPAAGYRIEESAGDEAQGMRRGSAPKAHMGHHFVVSFVDRPLAGYSGSGMQIHGTPRDSTVPRTVRIFRRVQYFRRDLHRPSCSRVDQQTPPGKGGPRG